MNLVKFLDKDQRDVILSALLVFLSTFFLNLLIEDTLMIWIFILPLQFLITKFLFASEVKLKMGFVIDIRSNKKIKQSILYCFILIGFIFLTFASFICSLVIEDEGPFSKLLQIFFILLPFITTRSYIFFNNLPLSKLYMFMHYQWSDDCSDSLFDRCNTFPIEDGFTIKVAKELEDWDMFISTTSNTRRHIHGD